MEKIPLFKVFMSPNIVEPVARTLQSGFVTQGPRVEEFEADLRKFLGVDHLVTLNSATAALTLAFRLLEQPDPEANWPGFDHSKDVVLSCPLTCFATNAAVLANRMKIRWVDTDGCQISLDDLEAKLTPETKIITFVHWGGLPVDLDRLDAILDRAEERFGFRPRVVEDGAHAFGAEYRGRKIGASGNFVAFSFQAIKHLTTCDGGLLVMPGEKLHYRATLLRWYGIDRNRRNFNYKDFRLEHDIAEWGYKFHMNDLNATIGIENLKYIPELLEKNRANSEFLTARLSKVDGVTPMVAPDGGVTAAWLFTVRVERKADFMKTMTARGVMVSQVHQRNDVNSCLAESVCELPALDQMEREIVCLPVGWWVTEEQRERIAAAVESGW